MVVIANENIAAGKLVNLITVSGVVKARLANALTGIPANAIATTTALSGAAVTVQEGITSTDLSGLEPWAVYVLGASGNVVKADKHEKAFTKHGNYLAQDGTPTLAEEQTFVHQKVGIGTPAGNLYVQIDSAIKLV